MSNAAKRALFYLLLLLPTSLLLPGTNLGKSMAVVLVHVAPLSY